MGVLVFVISGECLTCLFSWFFYSSWWYSNKPTKL